MGEGITQWTNMTWSSEDWMKGLDNEDNFFGNQMIAILDDMRRMFNLDGYFECFMVWITSSGYLAIFCFFFLFWLRRIFSYHMMTSMVVTILLF